MLRLLPKPFPEPVRPWFQLYAKGIHTIRLQCPWCHSVQEHRAAGIVTCIHCQEPLEVI